MSLVKFLKKFPVAVVITVLAIAGSIVYSQLVTPPGQPGAGAACGGDRGYGSRGGREN